MHEYVVNLHMHTPYSDGHSSHQEIAQAALETGLDIIIVTDHNVLVRGPEGYYKDRQKRLLMLIGQEIHDQARLPQKNHLLVFGAGRDLATFADDPQRLIDRVKQEEGLCFIAHPNDPAAPDFGETDISWVDWDVEGFNGMEIWNGLSELKTRLTSFFHAVYYVLNPRRVARGPIKETLERWDALLAEGHKIVGVGGSDAHALQVSLGPFRRTVFPYQYHFQAVNTHILTPTPLSGDYASDRKLVLTALRHGHAFIGYDLPASTSGFRFTAQGLKGTTWMGDEVSGSGGVTLQIRLPLATECRLIHNGNLIKTWDKRQTCTHITSETGAYRVEVYLPYLGEKRGWIFSNPIYVR